MTRRVTAALVAVVLSAALGAVACGPAPAESFPYQPLWPFASQHEADRWQRDGGDRWHADPEATALAFTRDFLGFTGLDRTTSVTEHVREAWVGVGYALPNGESSTAALVHLARFGTGPEAPWEVVGTIDDTLTLTSPAYGSAVTPMLEAGGTITGVDESLHVQVLPNTSDLVVGEYCCTAAGGQDHPWSVPVPVDTSQLAGTSPTAVTVVVWTGGHVAEVEAFAVTGLRVH